jgi:predicted alpha/beta-fold hydrolase
MAVEPLRRVHVLASILAAFFFLTALRTKQLSFLVTWFRSILGFGSVKLISAPKTVLLNRKQQSNSNGEDSLDTNQFSLRSLVEKIVTPIRLNPFLFNGHLQTISVASGWNGDDCHIYYKRKVWESDSEVYPGQFTIDFVVPTPAKPLPRDRSLPPRTLNFEENEWNDLLTEDAERPLVIVLHGFLGGSHEKYIRHALELLTAGGKEADFSVAVMNSRGCSYSKLTSPVMYHPQATWDIRQFVKWAKKQWPDRRLFAVGFSIGANVLCNYLGEEGEDCQLESAVLVGNPWNFDLSNSLMTNSFLGLNIYQRSLGVAYRKAFERHIDILSQNERIDIENARKSTYLWQWDR